VHLICFIIRIWPTNIWSNVANSMWQSKRGSASKKCSQCVKHENCITCVDWVVVWMIQVFWYRTPHRLVDMVKHTWSWIFQIEVSLPCFQERTTPFIYAVISYSHPCLMLPSFFYYNSDFSTKAHVLFFSPHCLPSRPLPLDTAVLPRGTAARVWN
jgi:hypothetical protein